jgi:L-iditol 2-dehydrogenase
MKAAALTGIRKIELREFPAPKIKNEADVLLHVQAAGLCGSDIQYYSTGRIGSAVVQYPFIVGHECLAEVEEVGREVKRVKPRDRVVIDPAMTCGQCDQCLQGRPNTCRSLQFMGCPGQLEGCLAEYITTRESNCFSLETDMKTQWGILAEPLSIGIYAIRFLDASQSSTAAILGSGPIGLSVALAAREAGIHKINMTDKIDERLQAARKVGAIWTGNPDRSDIVREILALYPKGLDAVFECCGDQEALDQAVELLRPGGKLLIVGIPETDIVTFDPHKLRRKEITIRNIRRQRGCIPAAIDLIQRLREDLGFMVTHTFKLEQAQDAFELVDHYKDGVIKAIIEP